MSTPAPSHRVFAQLADDVSWFMKAREVRVLHVATGASERPIALHQLALSEGHPHNRSPFFVLEDAHLAIEPGWLARAERMAVIHAERRELLAKEGMGLGGLEPLVHGANDLATFGRQIEQCLAAQRGLMELEGLVAVLAPGEVEQGSAMAASIVALTRERALAEVRLIVLELGQEVGKELTRALGDGVLRSRCEVDPAVYRREHVEAMRAAASAPADGAPEQLAGGAAPNGVLPPDIKQHAAALAKADPELLKRTLGAAAPIAGASGVALRQSVLGAALAVQEGDFESAIELQRNAARACAGMPRLECVLEVILATYQVQAKRVAAARKTFDVVIARAEREQLSDVAALACAGLGAALASRGGAEAREAVRVYTRAGDLAEKANEPVLAMECHRMAGQLSARTGAERAAEAAWKRALGVASVASAEVAAMSSAPIAARALAKVLMGHGSHAAAGALLDQADEMERAPIAHSPRTEPAPVTHAFPESA